MKRFLISILLISSFLFLSILSSAQISELNNISINKGNFEAKLGYRINDRPSFFLEGDFNNRGRIRIVRGIFTSSDIRGRFQGFFTGNSFFMTLPIRDRIQTIFGRIRVNDDYSTFVGSWTLRGIDVQGWISGEFKTRI